MTDILELAIRFADLWSWDHHRMVDEIYPAEFHMEAAISGRVFRNSAELHALEDELARRLPEHRDELVRVIVGESRACLELMLLTQSTETEFLPACLWWWVGDDGKVHKEYGWTNFAARTTDHRRVHGVIPPNDHRRRGDVYWYWHYAERMAQGWTTDPLANTSEHVAETCVKTNVGGEPITGREAILGEAERALETFPLAERRIEIEDVIGDGSVVAILYTAGTAAKVNRGAAVLNLDDADRISCWRYY